MAITLAADQTQRVNSMSSNLVVNVSGMASATTTGSIQIQLRPKLLADENLEITSQGQTMTMNDIVSTKAVYLKSAAFSSLTGQTGKTWIKIPLSDLSGSAGSVFSSLLQNVQNGDPLTQTRMLAASKNVHKVGTQVIDGVRTTHYAGTFTPAAAVAQLTTTLRKQVAPMLSMISGDVRFDAWIDASHQVRKIAEVETVSGETVNMTMTLTSINQPVHIALPAPRQVLVPPKSALGGGGSSSGSGTSSS
jgi:LppX_LprAFG lipoprotein